MAPLPPHEIQARVAVRQDEAARARAQNHAARYQYARPLGVTAVDLLDWMGNEDARLMFGLADIDAALRGIARGELCYVTGRAHSGKTQLIMHMIGENPKARIMLFTPDEVDNLVLVKLIARTHGINAAELERRVKGHDQAATRLVRTVAEHTYANLMVNDQSLTFHQMSQALREAEDQWGAAPDGVIVDYLDLLPGEADYNGTKGKSVALKRWAKTERVPVVCIHQPKRGGAERGTRIGMDDMNQGGETEATFVLGVYRKRDDYTLGQMEQVRHTNTLSVNIDKNKRPPGHVGQYDFYMDPQSGRIRELCASDLAQPGVPLNSLSEVLAARERAMSTQPNVDHQIDRALRLVQG